ncbi:MAG TPA: anti-sigma factor [Candidatus Fermentibacter daniensis]|nr:MAG: hypothetical protein AO395_03700 [Candidatus Fermentibacter daniensis]MBP7719478.1 zf-HC2 domain-containing protein [Candidatus Fermentibacter sp.]OQC70500.1 MAG: hypothetical protein BWX47_00338 [candidate division Hyd24-12 bacterium ADurb.Bin004]KZD18711.1 MAG: hypothetical protein AO396_00210 [Candidatus Fermentibacter daniensis]KZD20097.1 MAG: hypothetical protein AO394_09165 [Candidatus Fermentibacter daniensis]
MRCSREASNIQDYISGELSEEGRRRLENHLSGCESCRTCVDGMLLFRSRIRDLMRVSAPPDLRDRIAMIKTGSGR